MPVCDRSGVERSPASSWLESPALTDGLVFNETEQGLGLAVVVLRQKVWLCHVRVRGFFFSLLFDLNRRELPSGDFAKIRVLFC